MGCYSLVSEPSSWTIETTTLTDACVYPVNVCLRALCCMGLFKAFRSFCSGLDPHPHQSTDPQPTGQVCFLLLLCLLSVFVFSLVALTGFLDGRAELRVWCGQFRGRFLAMW